MPPTAPQVLGRRTNGTAAAATDKGSEPKKVSDPPNFMQTCQGVTREVTFDAGEG